MIISRNVSVNLKTRKWVLHTLIDPMNAPGGYLVFPGVCLGCRIQWSRLCAMVQRVLSQGSLHERNASIQPRNAACLGEKDQRWRKRRAIPKIMCKYCMILLPRVSPSNRAQVWTSLINLSTLRRWYINSEIVELDNSGYVTESQSTAARSPFVMASPEIDRDSPSIRIHAINDAYCLQAGMKSKLIDALQDRARSLQGRVLYHDTNSSTCGTLLALLCKPW
ncbi:hypothetical protein BKA67DRAFT_539533 [Truncatella angustata]|uniref:Uncharacterized protein n=1 Tax=Truncatella angustata TaxID=152316 RepID=A0A9P8RNY5_9PEZI|nr:uncharacterized protein BKA67DRAFT_539533 [Truncatella angustata]KAH6647685.1 hypothetical protein BKA67DRAFT_539533 [Truncatella angustata]